MKKITLLLILYISSLSIYSEISVKSFRKLDLISSAQLRNQFSDISDDSCSYICIATNLTDFSYINCGRKSIKKTVQSNGEIWLCVQTGITEISISHPSFGTINNYKFQIPVEKDLVYELVLNSNTEKPLVPSEITSQWLLIRPKPVNANIFINKILVKSGEYTGRYKPGTYSYTVEAPLYHSSSGTITITDQNVELNVELEPAFGYIHISTAPEEGANVILDGKLLQNTTPFKSAAVSSGEHNIQVMKELHQVATKKVYIDDDKVTKVLLTLEPNFATVNLKSNPNATVFVNGQPKGTGAWTGRLNAGIYSLEAFEEGYKSEKMDIELLEGETKVIDLKLTPILGAAEITTNPPGAKIILDGKEIGMSPQKFDNLIIGEHMLQLIKEGYITTSKKIIVEDKKLTLIDEVLSQGIPVKIKTIPSGANILIDGVEVGVSPYTCTLSVGNHTVNALQNKHKVEKTITVTKDPQNNNFELVLVSTQKNGTGTVAKNLNIDMVLIKGGTFTMGGESSETAQFNSMPAHQVTVNDYYLATTEVTQLLWKTVMGINPSKFQGDSLPVDDVSWNLVQEFLVKLNAIIGKKYRLPTEAEWEYAAGGGAQNRTKYAGTNSSTELPKYAWILENSNNRPHNVATKLPNKLGLYDMSGNVWEWCSDWLDKYPSNHQDNPTGAVTGIRRVNRGGAWRFEAPSSLVNGRGGYDPGSYNNRIGFRLAMSK